MVMQIATPYGGINANSRHSISGALEQAAADYERLSVSLSALLDELAAGRLGSHLVRHLDTNVGHERKSMAHEKSVESANNSVRVHLLGKFKLSVGGRDFCADMPGQLGTVLKYVISQGKRVTSRDALMELLWPDTDPDVASRRLRVVIHTLRKHLLGVDPGGGGVITTIGTGYMLNSNANLWVDTEEFEQRRESGWRLYRAGNRHEAFREYEKAESVYRGDFLEDEPYADWTLLRREALRDAYADVLSHLATISLHWEDYTGCIIWAQKLLAQDSCSEDAYCLLIESHRRLGQKSRAIYWYDLCARTLDKELGLQPSVETRALLA